VNSIVKLGGDLAHEGKHSIKQKYGECLDIHELALGDANEIPKRPFFRIMHEINDRLAEALKDAKDGQLVVKEPKENIYRVNFNNIATEFRYVVKELERSIIKQNVENINFNLKEVRTDIESLLQTQKNAFRNKAIVESQSRVLEERGNKHTNDVHIVLHSILKELNFSVTGNTHSALPW